MQHMFVRARNFTVNCCRFYFHCPEICFRKANKFVKQQNGISGLVKCRDISNKRLLIVMLCSLVVSNPYNTHHTHNGNGYFQRYFNVAMSMSDRFCQKPTNVLRGTKSRNKIVFSIEFSVRIKCAMCATISFNLFISINFKIETVTNLINLCICIFSMYTRWYFWC